eukprot:TRINITY_DN3715_c0_g1_i4.p1 TRINITY_DN3715_c0_g1~~TRINITY_DN3715_c0_g1_i4.p1  ORF type:complete len:474 (-),score=141.12 TRINITY_DN3715_c0_g1_i4:2158-3579(-)
MDSYNSYDFSGGLFLSSHTSSLGLGNLDRLTPSAPSANNVDNNNFGHYNIFTSFDRPKLPFLGDANSAVDSLGNATAYSGGSSSDDDENSRPSSTTTTPQRLPLFRRCPLTNRAGMVNEQQSSQQLIMSSPSKNYSSGGKMKSSMSLSPLKNLSLNSPKKSAAAAGRSYQQSAVATSLFGRDDNGLTGLEGPAYSSASNNYAGYGDYDPLKGITSVAGNTRIQQGLNLQYFINQERSSSNTINNSNNVSPNNSFSSSGSSIGTEGVRSLSYLDSLTNNNNNNTVAATYKTATYSQMARKEPSPPSSTGLDAVPRNTAAPVQTSYVPPANPKPASSKNVVAKLSLDDVKDDSVVAMNNKHGKGKYWFKSGCPTPDPRWPSCQQLMIGPIPGDVEYSTLRSAFLSKGHTIHLFIQNNQAWLEKNQEKFGKKQVKFGYVVYTERETARRLLHNGYVPVGTVRIRVKEMDGQPAVFL